MKRFVTLFLACVIVLSAFAGCGKEQTPDTTAQTTITETKAWENFQPSTAATEETTVPYDPEYAALMQQVMDSMQNGNNHQGGTTLDDQPGNTNQNPNTTPSAAEIKKSKFQVGYAKVDITPSLDLKLPLIGNGDQKTRVATGVLERLWANCVAMTDEDGTTLILFGVDTHSISKPLLDGVRQGITKATGIDGKYVQMTASHTHQGPPMSQDGYGYSDGAINLQATIEKCVQAAKDALEDRKSAVMSTAYTRAPGINHVRYYMLQDGTLLGNARQSDMAQYYHEAQTPDDLLQIVKFTRTGGKDVALVNWQAHYRGNPSDQYTKYSSDYMGVLRQELLTQANCESVFLLGASGNLTSMSSMYQLNTEAAADYKTVGKALATAAITAMNKATTAKTGKITLQSSNFYTSVNKDAHELHAFGIGEVGFVMLPIEPFQSIGMHIRDESPYKMTLIGTCANNTASHGYVPDAQAYGAVNPYGVSKRYVQGDETKIENQMVSMLKKCFQKAGLSKQTKGSGYVSDTSPRTDPVTYTTTAEAPKAVKNGLYQVKLRNGTTTTTFLVKGETLANKIASKTTVKISLDGSNVIVAVQ